MNEATLPTQRTGVLTPGSTAWHLMDSAARRARIVVFCGIPGVGKSFLLREQLTMALNASRRVTRLQWDVCRQAFETPPILSRYPEINGSTHIVIRRAVGLWARGAIEHWAATHTGSQHMLLVEAPLVGGRLVELAQSEGDAAEPLLNARETCYYVPTPTVEVRRAIEAARRSEMELNRHARDAANAVPELVDELWQMVATTAALLNLRTTGTVSSYSPETYFSLYRAVLRHRHVASLPIDQIVSNAGSPHDVVAATEELAPSSADVLRLVGLAESEGLESIALRTERWYET